MEHVQYQLDHGGGPVNYWDSPTARRTSPTSTRSSAFANVSGTVYVNGIQFDNTANIQGGTINLVTGTLATPTITMNASSGTIGSVLTGTAGLVYGGSGLLDVTGVNTYTGGTTVNGGTLEIDLTSQSTNTALNLGTFTVNSGASLQLNNNAATTTRPC